MTDRIADIWGERTPHGSGQAWSERVDQVLAEGLTDADVDRWVQSACVLCSNGCGCDIAVKDGRMVGVRGRAAGPGQPRPAGTRRASTAAGRASSTGTG